MRYNQGLGNAPTLEEMLAQADQIQDPQVQESAKQRIESRWQADKASQAQIQSVMKQQAADKLDAYMQKSENLLDAGATVDFITKQPEWFAANDETRKKIIAYANDIAAKDKPQKTTPEGWQAWTAFMGMASNPDQADAASKISSTI